MNIAEILAHSKLTPTAKLVAIWLMDYAGQSPVVIENKAIAEGVSCSSDKASLAINSLADQKIIQISRDRKGVRSLIISELTGGLRESRSLDDSRRLDESRSLDDSRRQMRWLLMLRGFRDSSRLRDSSSPPLRESRRLDDSRRHFKMQRVESQDFLPCFPYEVLKRKKSSTYLYYINIYNNIIINNKLFKKNVDFLKTKKYDVARGTDGVPKCRVLYAMVNQFRKDHKDLYPPGIYNEFIKHFSAVKNEKNGMPLWYHEKTRKTFDLPLRLAQWAGRNYSKHISNEASNRPSKAAPLGQPSKLTGANVPKSVEL